MDTDTYSNLSSKDLDGCKTENHLRAWFQTVLKSSSELNFTLNENKTVFLVRFEKSTNKKSHIKVSLADVSIDQNKAKTNGRQMRY